MTNYLVTGGAGFIGSHLVEALSGRGGRVRVLDDFSTGRRQNLDNIPSAVEPVEGSILDRPLLARLMKETDCCVHMAALPSVTRSLKDPAETTRVNVEGTVAVLDSARREGVAKVVCASSSSVYGPEVELPARETAPVDPISPYAASKAAGEVYSRVFSNLYGLPVTCLRFFNVFGPRQDPESPYAGVVPAFIRRVLRGEPPVVDGDGSQSRDFTFVENVVDAVLSVCEKDVPRFGIYNIACGDSTSVLDLAKLLAEIAGADVEPVFVDPRPGDIRHSRADISLARDTFAYAPRVPLREGLERTVASFTQLR